MLFWHFLWLGASWAETGLSLREGDTMVPSLVLISCLDGTLVALDRATGREQWSTDALGGALLSGSSEEMEEPAYLIEPLFPGHLYLFPSGRGKLIRVRRDVLFIENPVECPQYDQSGTAAVARWQRLFGKQD